MTAVDFNDADLATKSLAGDRDAFAQIVSQYQSLVCSLAYSATGSLSQSEDLAQEIFLKAWRELAKLKEPQKLRSWLCAIARNTIVDALRGRHREPVQDAETLDAVVEFSAADMPVADRVIQREEEAILWRSLEQIPENYREPLILFYREGESVERVARELELSEDAVKQRLSRGRKLLAEEVTAFMEDTLKRSTPGRAFTVAVVGALPVVTGSASVASVSAISLQGAQASCVSQPLLHNLIMNTTLKITCSVLAVAGIGTALFYQQQSKASLREQNRLSQQRVEQLAEENQRLSKNAAEAASDSRLPQEQLHELLRLRGEVGQLRETKARTANSQSSPTGKALPEAPAPGYLAKESWAFAGYGDPKAAFQSGIWAMGSGDVNAFLESMSIEEQARVQKDWGGKSKSEVAQRIANEINRISGFRILKKEQLKDDEVLLSVLVDSPKWKGRLYNMQLKREGENWKMAGPLRPN